MLANPFYPVNNSYTTVTEDGLYGISGVGNSVQAGDADRYEAELTFSIRHGTYAYNPDRNNLAPSGGFAWQLPGHDKGFARLLLGSEEGDSVIRGGGAMAFQRPGMSDFTGVFGAEPGHPRSTLNRDTRKQQPRHRCRCCCGTSAADAAGGAGGSYPQSPSTITNTRQRRSTPNLQMPYTQSYYGRLAAQAEAATRPSSCATSAAAIVRTGETVNINEINITTNGFADEFRKAQAQPAGEHRGRPRRHVRLHRRAGTSPLPTFAAFFDRVPAAQRAGDPTKLRQHAVDQRDEPRLPRGDESEPVRLRVDRTPTTRASIGNATFRNNGDCRRLSGRTYFVANPDVIGTATSASFRRQPDDERRRHPRATPCRLNSGSASRTGFTFSDQLRLGERVGAAAIRLPASRWRTSQQVGQTGNVQHAVKANWLYELPFGKDQRWGGGASRRSRTRSSAAGRSTASRASRPARQLDFGDVRLVGMSGATPECRQAAAGPTVERWPDLHPAGRHPSEHREGVRGQRDVGRTATARSAPPPGRYLAPANGPDCIETAPGYGDCGLRSLIVNAPRSFASTSGAVKRVQDQGKRDRPNSAVEMPERAQRAVLQPGVHAPRRRDRRSG